MIGKGARVRVTLSLTLTLTLTLTLGEFVLELIYCLDKVSPQDRYP
jgi:hypothetical protein